MRIFSDFRIFEKPPRNNTAIVRWIAWRLLVLGAAFLCLVAIFTAISLFGGETIEQTNDNRALTDGIVSEAFETFLTVGGAFFILGLFGILLVPKE